MADNEKPYWDQPGYQPPLDEERCNGVRLGLRCPLAKGHETTEAGPTFHPVRAKHGGK